MTQEPPAREHDSDLRGGTREGVDRSSCRVLGVDLFLSGEGQERLAASLPGRTGAYGEPSFALSGGKPRVAIARRNGRTIVAGARN